MKRIVKVLVVFILVLLIASYFIPVIKQNEIPIANTLNNVSSTLSMPRNWIKWNPSVRDAWQKDSTACRFMEDTVHQSATIEIPGKKFTITQASALNFQVEVTNDRDISDFILSIAPELVNIKPGYPHHSMIAYAYNSRWFYKIFPFLESSSFAQQTVPAFSAFLNDADRFYGYPIHINPATDTFFVTQKKSFPSKDLFKKLPILFDSLDQYSLQNHLKFQNKNVAFTNISGDSLEILAGVNIDKIIEGDYLHQFMQLPGTQILAVAHFEGRFRDRNRAYDALKKYLYDHALATQGVCFEKYLSPLPLSDSSFINMELSYPLRTTY